MDEMDDLGLAAEEGPRRTALLTLLHLLDYINKVLIVYKILKKHECLFCF